MPFNDVRASFVAVSPAFRDREFLSAEISLAGSGKASDAAKAAIAEIEMAVSDADAAFRSQAFTAALSGYERARALIYRFLHPAFDVHAWVRDINRSALPVGAVIEAGLLDASASLADVIRPQTVAAVAVSGLRSDVKLDPSLVRYTTTGFRPAASAQADLEVTGSQALALMNDGKPELAAALMQGALDDAVNSGGDPHAIACLQLNLASALVQTGDAAKAVGVAARAVEAFHATNDVIGIAQALHTQGVSVAATGDKATADALFAQAEKTLEGAVPLPPTPPAAAPGLAALGGLGGLGNLVGRTRVGPGIDGTIDRTRLIGRVGGIDVTTLQPVESVVAVAAPLLAGLGSRDPSVLAPVRDKDPDTMTLRLPGRADGWTTTAVVDQVDRAVGTKAWTVGIAAGQEVVQLPISAAAIPTGQDVADAVYKRRISGATLADLSIVAGDASTTTYYLTHLYAYVLPVKIGDTRYELGQYQQAEAAYVEASAYTYLNDPIESTSLWIRLAKNAVEWGNVRYKALDLDGAKAQYSKLVAEDATVPGSILYTTASLHTPADVARSLVQHLSDRPLPEVQWEISSNVLIAFALIQQILEGLDFYGLALSPIHTFEYLQSVARGFAQESVQAERDYVNFKSRQEAEEATRRDLEAAAAMAQAQADAQLQQYESAQDDVQASQRALDLATKRRDDAVIQRNNYAASSWTQIWSQAASTAQGMGSDSWFNEISELADKLNRGESISGERGKLAAAYVLQAGRQNRDYELAKMQDNINELNAAIPVAQEQVSSANHRAIAAEIGWQAAIQRAQMANSSLDAFDANLFTPDAWATMAAVMKDITRDYLWRAIRIAKLMERAYNFENDTTLSVIRDDYGHAVSANHGADGVLLGGDSLLNDIDSFTYQAIVAKVRKSSRIKDVVSLATTFPSHFEEFRQTGLLSFETDLYEFDRLHPGFYGQRIEAVELEFVGLVPEDGLNGTLSAGGVTRYRTRIGGVGQRTHQVDTMAVSDYRLRDDVFVFTAETGVRGLFQGLGLGTTWQLHLPKRSNQFDFRRVVDVRVVVYYTALFDVALRSTVLAAPARPGELNRVRDFNLRYDFPEAWYGFYRAGTVSITLDAARLPAHQQDFMTSSLHARVVTKTGVDPAGITLHVTSPVGGQADAVTDANGVVDLTAALPALTGATPLGAWQFAVTSGASVTDAGTVHPDRVLDLQLGLDYAFQYPVEAL